MITKKEFIKAAAIVKKHLPEENSKKRVRNTITAKTVASAFVELFQESNPRFDHQRFYEACGFNSEEL